MTSILLLVLAVFGAPDLRPATAVEIEARVSGLVDDRLTRTSSVQPDWYCPNGRYFKGGDRISHMPGRWKAATGQLVTWLDGWSDSKRVRYVFRDGKGALYWSERAEPASARAMPDEYAPC